MEIELTKKRSHHLLLISLAPSKTKKKNAFTSLAPRKPAQSSFPLASKEKNIEFPSTRTLLDLPLPPVNKEKARFLAVHRQLDDVYYPSLVGFTKYLFHLT